MEAGWVGIFFSLLLFPFFTILARLLSNFFSFSDPRPCESGVFRIQPYRLQKTRQSVAKSCQRPVSQFDKCRIKKYFQLTLVPKSRVGRRSPISCDQSERSCCLGMRMTQTFAWRHAVAFTVAVRSPFQNLRSLRSGFGGKIQRIRRKPTAERKGEKASGAASASLPMTDNMELLAARS